MTLFEIFIAFLAIADGLAPDGLGFWLGVAVFILVPCFLGAALFAGPKDFRGPSG